MYSLLVVEDAPDFQIMIQRVLSGPGFRLKCVETAAAAIEELDREIFDLVLLDIILPDGEGYRVCTRMQSEERTRNTPVFFLTGKTDVDDKIRAFSLGADDYIVKPFDPLELKARIEAKLAKKKIKDSTEDTFRKGKLKIDLGFQKAFQVGEDGKENDLRLTPAEFKLLHYLIRNEGKLCSRSQLLSAIWGKEVHVLDHNVYTHICALRRKLADRAEYIESVPRLGYRFVVR
jgi:two-component system, OmpR family, phosphate regulon response regulator PhoB